MCVCVYINIYIYIYIYMLILSVIYIFNELLSLVNQLAIYLKKFKCSFPVSFPVHQGESGFDSDL